MTERDASVTEDELHAYVDGALPADRIAAIEDRLASDPEAASRVAAWRAQATSIRAKWERVVEEPVPDRLRLENIALRASGTWRKIAVAAVIAFVIGAAGGWYANEYSGFDRNEQVTRAIADAAIEAHRLYINEVRHPIEVRAGEAHLLPWLSRRVGSTVRAPDLAPEGLQLMGGRRVPAQGRPRAAASGPSHRAR